MGVSFQLESPPRHRLKNSPNPKMGERLANDEKHEEVERADGDWKHFLFDKENKTVLGRTASSWLSVTAFYALYYSLIAVISYCSILGYQNNMLIFPNAKDAQPATFNRVSTPGVASFPGVDQINIEASKEKLTQLGDCSPICADTEAECVNPPLKMSYQNGNPCIVYQINKVMNWKPFAYHSLNDEYITPRAESGNSMLAEAVDSFEPNKVYLYCYDLDLVRGFVNETDRFTATYYSSDDANSNEGESYHNTLVNVACQTYAANLGPNEGINEGISVMPITVMAAGESSIAQINEDYRD